MDLILRDFPAPHELEELAQRFQELDPKVLTTIIQFMRTSRDMYTELTSGLSEVGLSQGKFVLLMILLRKKDHPLTPSDLAGQAGVTRGTITGLIDGLERDGLIKRSSHHSDRRRITIQLTEAAEQLLEKVLPNYLAMTTLLMADFTSEDHAYMMNLLSKMKKGLERVQQKQK